MMKQRTKSHAEMGNENRPQILEKQEQRRELFVAPGDGSIHGQENIFYRSVVE